MKHSDALWSSKTPANFYNLGHTSTIKHSVYLVMAGLIVENDMLFMFFSNYNAAPLTEMLRISWQKTFHNIKCPCVCTVLLQWFKISNRHFHGSGERNGEQR